MDNDTESMGSEKSQNRVIKTSHASRVFNSQERLSGSVERIKPSKRISFIHRVLQLEKELDKNSPKKKNVRKSPMFMNIEIKKAKAKSTQKIRGVLDVTPTEADCQNDTDRGTVDFQCQK